MLENLILICFMLMGTCLAQNSLVYMWGSPSNSKPTLQTVTREDFQKIVAPKLKDSMILVFLENGLESEDLSMCHHKETKQSCFENLKSFDLHNYYAGVELPVHVLKDFNVQKEYVKLNNSGDLITPINYEIGKIVFMELDDSAEDRTQTLIKHDDAIANVYEKLSKFGPTFAIYTSQPQYLSRRARQAKKKDFETDESSPILITDQKNMKIISIDNIFLLAYSNLILREMGKEDIEINIDGATVYGAESHKYWNIDLSTDQGDLSFDIDFNLFGYWHINEFEFQNNNYSTNILVSTELSYYCGTNTFHSQKNSKQLIWNNLQIQPGNYVNNGKIYKFSDPWHCVGFTSPGIWMGLFVSFLFLFIISIGITWLMSINTMDRFDDPKGKTITINANE